MNKAIFLDRDGVLIKDIHLLISKNQIIFEDQVFSAFKLLKDLKFKLIVVSNQTVVARGMATETEVETINEYIAKKIYNKTKVQIEKFYFCPHHPNATMEKYRINCECRKPKPGMLLTAATNFNIDISQSYMIGDRISDIIAGSKAGCKTIFLKSGMHNAAPIESDSMDLTIKPDFTCNNLLEAIKKIKEKCNISERLVEISG